MTDLARSHRLAGAAWAALMGATLVAGCGSTSSPQVSATRPSRSHAAPSPLALPSGPAMSPSLPPGWGDVSEVYSGVGPTSIQTGMDSRTRGLFVEVTCSGKLPLVITDSHGEARMRLAAPKTGGPCSAADAYQFTASGADRVLRVETARSTRWALRIWLLFKG